MILRLTRPDPDLLFKLALPAARPVPAGTPRTQLSTAPVPSTGPYRVAALDPTKRLLLVRNGFFHEWSRAAQPDGYPDQIDIRMDTYAGRRVGSVLHGQSDVALEVATANLGDQRTRFASQLRRHDEADTTFFNFNVRRPPFNDVRARRAVNLALIAPPSRGVSGDRSYRHRRARFCLRASPVDVTTAPGRAERRTVAGTPSTSLAPARSSRRPARPAPRSPISQVQETRSVQPPPPSLPPRCAASATAHESRSHRPGPASVSASRT